MCVCVCYSIRKAFLKSFNRRQFSNGIIRRFYLLLLIYFFFSRRCSAQQIIIIIRVFLPPPPASHDGKQKRLYTAAVDIRVYIYIYALTVEEIRFPHFNNPEGSGSHSRKSYSYTIK